jgi:acetolactate synthase-1/2/3 large subunit
MSGPHVREALASQLADAGVEVLFGLMGDGNMLFVLDCVERHGMRFVNARHETAAVLMADGFSRASGKLAAVTMTHGPGLAAAAVGIGVATAARARVLVIAGDTGRAEALHVQRLDQETFARSVANDVVSLRTGAGALSVIRRALTRAASEGPVVLNLAVDVQEEVATHGPVAAAAPAFAAAVPIADEAAVRALTRLLAESRRPVLVAGRGARHAAQAIAALAERSHALLGTTVHSRGLFHGDRRDAGVVGGLAVASTRAALAEADLVIGFGASLNRFTTDFGRIAPSARWACVSLAGAATSFQVELAARVHGDAADVATRVAALLEGGPRSEWTAGDMQALRHEEAIEPRPPHAGGIDPRIFCREANERLPRNRAEVVGVGHFGGFAAIASRLDAEGLFLAPWEFGSIGVAVPVALGAALARPDRLTVAWEGDGSLLSSLGELETLARMQARVLVIVMDDGAYLAEVRKLRLAGRATDLARFGRSDLAAVARGLGLAARTVREPAEVAPALDALLACSGPAVLHVHVDPEVHQSVF